LIKILFTKFFIVQWNIKEFKNKKNHKTKDTKNIDLLLIWESVLNFLLNEWYLMWVFINRKTYWIFWNLFHLFQIKLNLSFVQFIVKCAKESLNQINLRD
jgi:hypothetical protein